MSDKTVTTKLLVLAAILLLGACKENKCAKLVPDSAGYQSAFDHCMGEAAQLSKAGTHDNSYDTVEECQDYALRMVTAKCDEKNHE